MPRLQLASPDGSTATVYQHGAHISHFQPAGQSPVLWMSQSCVYDGKSPLRGGVPICFPWFGPHAERSELPSHGYARIRPWDVDSITSTDTHTIAVFSMTPNDAELEMFPNTCHVRLTVTLSSALTMALEITNTSDSAFTISTALHSYFEVDDVKNVNITGLENTQYLSKVEGGTYTQDDQPIKFTRETDRVYQNTTTTCLLHDPDKQRQIAIEKTGSKSTVVWNPWIEKSKNMPDFGDDEWPSMCCIETAAAGPDAITIEPGQAHTITAKISAQST